MFNGIAPFTRSTVAAIKSHIRAARPEYKSSHVDEALAFAFGFRTHAAMLAALEQLGETHLHAQVNPNWFSLRLSQLGYPGISTDAMHTLIWSAKVPPHPELIEREAQVASLFKPRPANDQ